MSLLINLNEPDWMTDEALRDQLSPLLPDVNIYCGTPEKPLPDVSMLAMVGGVPDIWHLLPNLQLLQKMGAGVDGVLSDTKLPAHMRVARLAPDMQAQEIAEYCLTYVMAFQRNAFFHERNAQQTKWETRAPKKTHQTTVTVLGLGNIGKPIAELFCQIGFKVKGWSRSPKSLSGMECFSGQKGLAEAVADSDYIASILPTTPETQHLFDQHFFSMLEPNTVFINVGRGQQVVDQDLIKALNQQKLAAAVLDVFHQEPLPQDHPFWSHEQVIITPHVAGWHIDGGINDVVKNYRRLMAGEPLLHEVDRSLGY